MKIFRILIIAMLFASQLKAQVADSTALIIIDIQEFYFPGGSVPLVNPEQAAENAATLLKYFRVNNRLVIHVGHLSASGSAFHQLVKPETGEKVFIKKEVNAFLNSDLDKYLKNNGIKRLVLCGMQTHMCLEAATRAGRDLGYACTVAADACATRDLTYGEITVKAADVHASTLATLRSYAKITTTTELVK